MVRLEFKEGSSNKFWELALSEAEYTVRWGRVGANGQEKKFTFPSSLKAKTEADKLIASKKKKGYVEVSKGKTAAGKKQAPKAAPRDPALEKLIAKNPSDPTNYLVYGDWLTQKGDPRGELVSVQHALSELSAEERKGPKGKALANRERSILNANANFTGVSKKLAQPRWRWGFIESVLFNNDDDWMDDENKIDVPKLCREVLASPAMAAVTSLEVAILRWDYVGKDVATVLKAFGESPYASQITSLRIGPKKGDDVDVGMYEAGKGPELISKYFPNLEELIIHASSISLGTINLPKLRTLKIETCGLSKKNMASIVAAKWPKLERAELWFGSDDYGGNCKLKDLTPILEGKVFPKIEHLGLMNSEITDRIAEALVNAPILRRLKTLDLSLGTMARDGAKAILDNAKAFAHLEQLNVNDNFLTKAEVQKLKKLGKPPVVSKEQKDDDDSVEGEIYRYVTVSE